MERKGITYVECKRTDCRYLHLMVDGRAYAEWTHPQEPPMSPFVRRALAGELPAKALAR